MIDVIYYVCIKWNEPLSDLIIRIVKSILFYFRPSKIVSSVFGYGFDFKSTYVMANKIKKIYYFFDKKFNYFHYRFANRIRAQLL